MLSLDEIDLSEIDPASWRVLVKGTPYGPYTTGQMKTFVNEGRLNRQTPVAESESAPFIPAGDVPALEAVFAARAQEQSVKLSTKPAQTTSNFVIITHLNGTPEATLVAALNAIGRFGEATPGVFILRSKLRIGDVQRRIQDKLQPRDQVIIVDASNNRLAWSNLGPEIDAHLRAIWDTSSA